MQRPNLPLFFLLALKASFFSVSGMGNVPSLHADLLARHWATDPTFAEAIAIGQASPGPNGLWVVSLGYLIGALPGALCAAAAIVPPLFVVLVWEQVFRGLGRFGAADGFIRGLSLATAGVFAVVLCGLLQSVEVNAFTLFLVAFALFLGATRKIPVVGILIFSALIAMGLQHLSLR